MEIIDIAAWERREIYEYFSKNVWPFYAITFPLEVTRVKETARERGLSFYALMAWVVGKAVNSVPQFRLRIRDGRVVRLDVTHPATTFLRPGAGAFQFATLRWDDDMAAFCAKAEASHQRRGGLFDDGEDVADIAADELIFITCTPWFDFTSLSNERDGNTDDAIPRIAWGKYYPEGDKLMLHMSLEVNHRTIDGMHIGQLVEALEREISAL